MNKKIIRLTESDLNRVIKESVKKILKENNIEQLKQYREEELKLYQDLETFLKRNGIENVYLKDNGNNIKLSLPTMDYDKEVKSLLDRFASSKQMFINDYVYPAMTYITLTTY